MTVIRSTFILAFVIYMTSCKNLTEEQSAETSNQADTTKRILNKDSLLQLDKDFDTLKADSQITVIKKTDKALKRKTDKSVNPMRYIEFPGDAHFNGKPITQQENISKKILEKHPDTLSKLAIAHYKTFDHFFPKSIADNFEKGISTERIHYPGKLIFRFELFENESSWKPYIVKEVTVRRNPNGELYTE